MTPLTADPVDALLLDEARAFLADTAVRTVVVLDDTTGALCRGAAGLLAEGADRRGAVFAHCDSLVDEQRLPDGVVRVSRLAGLKAAIGTPDQDQLRVDPTQDQDQLGRVVALVRLPKSVTALGECAEQLAAAGVDHVLAGGRVKHMTRSMNQALAARYRQVRASLGRQKSRVLLASSPTPGEPTWPRSRKHHDVVTPTGSQQLTLSAHGATFGGTNLDLGTRLLIEHLDPGPASPDAVAVDLGCGNGTIAVLLARAGWPTRALDVSAAAVAATAESAAANGLTVDTVRADGLTVQAPASADLIVCNPPFHVGTAKDSGPALTMFADAPRVLRPGGQFWCVFNSHLPWLPALRRIGPTSVVAQNRQYTVTRSMRRAD